MDGTYYVVKNKATGLSAGPPGVSQAPHLYSTKGKVEGQRKRFWHADDYEVVPIYLTEFKKGVLA